MAIIEPEVMDMKDKSYKPRFHFLAGINKYKVKKYLPAVGLILTLVLLVYGFGDFRYSRENGEPGEKGLPVDQSPLEEEYSAEIADESTSVEDDIENVEPALGSPAMLAQLPPIDLHSMVAPVSGQIVADFGWREYPLYGDWRYHPGIDIATSPGTFVLAALPGIISDVQREDLDSVRVVLQHNDGINTVYSGVSTVLVEAGDIVEAGQVIATMNENDPLLYFQVSVDDSFVDPTEYLK